MIELIMVTLVLLASITGIVFGASPGDADAGSAAFLFFLLVCVAAVGVTINITKPITADQIDWAIKTCKDNGGLKALDFNEIVCHNGAVFDWGLYAPTPEKETTQEDSQ